MTISHSWEQFKHLDEDAYAQELLPLSPEQLTAEHARITRKLISASMGTGVGALSVPASGGFSLVPMGIQGRRTHVNRRRLRIIETRLAALHAPKYRPRKRDFAIPAAVNIAAMGMTTGVENLIGAEGFIAGGPMGAHFVADGAAGAANLANAGAPEVFLAGSHLVSGHVVDALGTAAEMAQEPLYAKLGEEANESHARSEAKPVVPSVPSAQFVVPAWDQRMPSVPSPHFAHSSQSSSQHLVPSIPSPSFAPPPYTLATSSPKLGGAASPWLALPESLPPALPQRPKSALAYARPEPSPSPAQLSPALPPRPTTPSMLPLWIDGSAPLPPERPASAIGLPIAA